VELRDIRDLDGCRAVVGVQEQVWGRDSEVVPASLLVASIKRGGVLVGAYEGTELVGFVWSLPGWRDGDRTHWSHMLGVVPDARGHRTGERLKWAQRDRVLAQGVALVEWTFDPLQALNAHLNLSILGSVARAYLVDVYGRMSGPLHRGTPTDRLVAEWWLERPHVQRRHERRDQAASSSVASFTARSREVMDASPALTARAEAGWDACGDVRTDLDDARVTIAVPARFGEMQQTATDLAVAWRDATRRAFQTYLARGYQAVDFFVDRQRGGGMYLLSRPEA
jgi:predicted GNAT superfamily acetyltransferase